MATLASRQIPCVIEYADTYHEEQSLTVLTGETSACIEVRGLEDTVLIYLSLDELTSLIDDLTSAEEFVAEAEMKKEPDAPVV